MLRIIPVRVIAPGLNVATGDPTLAMSDEELRGGVFTLAVRDAEECGSFVEVKIEAKWERYFGCQ